MNFIEENDPVINYKQISTDFETFDYQGISWLELTNKTRNIYRAFRNHQYHPYLSENQTQILSRFPQKFKLSPSHSYYKFINFYKNLTPIVGHFQLRYNLQASSYHDLYFLTQDSVVHYCTIRKAKRKFAIPSSIYPVCLTVLGDFFALGDSIGKLYLFDIKRKSQIFSGFFLENEEKHIVNSVKIYKENEKYQILIGANDAKIRILDFDNILKPILLIQRPNPINFVSLSPNLELIGSYSDQKEAEILDVKSGKVAFSLGEHEDYGFCMDWHPNGVQIATGNQDTTCRIWDIRRCDKSLHVLQGEIGSIYTTKYSNDGRFLVMGEAIDYVNIYDCKKDYGYFQQIDYFGETAGVDFNPEDSKSLFVAINIKDYDGIFEFRMRKNEEKMKKSFL